MSTLRFTPLLKSAGLWRALPSDNRFRVVLLFLVALLLYVPVRSQFAYHWDSAEFALAVQEYNVALSHPHAPGYFLYVMAGRLLNLLVGDPHAALVWLSVLAGAGLAAALYALGAAMYDRRVGWLAAVFTMTSPQIWFHSAVALTYIVDALLVTVTVLWCWRAMARGGRWSDAIGVGVLLAIVGGVRQQSVPALVPLVAFAAWKFRERRFWKFVAIGAAAFVAGLLWFVPMVMMSGGLALYLEVVRRHAAFNAPATLLGGGLEAFLWNVFFAGLFVGHGLMLGVVVLFAALLYRARWLEPERKGAFDRQHQRAWALLALWIGAFAVAGTVGFTKQPGYVLGYLPALWLLVAVSVAHIRRVAGRGITTALVVAANVFTFLAWPAAWDGVFFDLARTRRELREHDRLIADTVRVIRERYRPDEVTLLHAKEYLWLGLMHFHLYLPEYEQYQLCLDPAMVTPPGQPMMSVRGGRLQFVAEVDLGGRPTVVLLVPYPLTVAEFAKYFDVSPARRVSDTVYEMDAQAWQR